MFIFDFDGVIVDSLAYWAGACQYAVSVQQPGVDIGLNPFADLDPVTFDALATTLRLDLNQFHVDISQYLKINKPMPALFAGIPAMLNTVGGHAPLYILSASHSPLITRILTLHGIANHFESVVGGDTPGNKQEKITTLLREQATAQSSAVMVGDGASDMSAAVAAGVVGVGVGWGWQDTGRLRSHGAGHVVETPHALGQFLHSFAN